MTKHPWLPWYVNDYRADTFDLEPDQHGIYMLLLMLAWASPDAALPNDMAWLKSALQASTKMHGHTFNRLVPPLLKRYFVLGEDGNWRQKRLSQEKARANFKASKLRQNSYKRWKKSNENNETTDAIASKNHIRKKESSFLGESQRVQRGLVEGLDTASQKGQGSETPSSLASAHLDSALTRSANGSGWGMSPEATELLKRKGWINGNDHTPEFLDRGDGIHDPDQTKRNGGDKT